ncbi:2-oxo-3-hexenedioate decarboxylase [Tistlia consotensis]|uniref:2-oxo-3-hexenedioate decarboxylase n=1 Tax=Tistlia consotensis USBA 355 TaxID=560819 RepID=A0A1Y6CIJ7_9PROT|nr:hydratase [Tistlia consotensis]SMF56744.1 2-oxo-3-hexenedioate decarboxylase [Tistlia consotensis USBA 355]SNR44982.1 2-oxo-3-hexenedioate decarboxylase [Tistlia consotensis]
MTTIEGEARTDEVAEALLAILGTGRQIVPVTRRLPGFGLAEAYRVTDRIRRLREARGERPVGRKIGFTNRTIWDEYGVHAPIWAPVYDTTLHAVAEACAGFALAGFAEPRLEPEIVFGLGHAPEPGMDEAALLGCLDWVAHGFEIVQSVFPGWIFEAADTVAAFGLHGALLVGPRSRIEPGQGDWLASLSAFEIELRRDGELIDRGRAANVLDGPLSALKHLVGLLAEDPVNPPLAAGELVTTGTLTRAFPVVPGERWRTRLTGVALGGIEIAFV